MLPSHSDPLTIAVRVFPEPDAEGPRKSKPIKAWRRPTAMLVFDTETRTDATQTMTFGSYRYVINGQCVEEGLFADEGLSESELEVLKQYVSTHNAHTVGRRELRLLTRSQFVERLFLAAYKGRCLLVGFNLPFDLSRVARGAATARGRFSGGFSLRLWSYLDGMGIEQFDPHRPGIGVKHIDSKRALKGFTSRLKPDQTDLIPESSATGEPEPGHIFRGHFLDLRTLAFALTDRGYSLETACEAFGVAHPKQKVAVHGVITEQYIDYNRRDVLATAELAQKLIEEYERHPISLQFTKAYSPASIGKAYLDAMGIVPILKRQPDFPRRLLGYAASAFFGGRTSAHVRKAAVPVVYTDFLSMYPTVNSLMDLWRFVIARRVDVVENCESEIKAFLDSVTPETLFNPSVWPRLTAFVQVIPEGDILPTRGKYSRASNDWQVAVNHLHAGNAVVTPDVPVTALWFSLPDVVASVLLTGRVPRIVNAFRIKAVGVTSGLKAVSLRGKIAIDPRKQDFFRVAIEERKTLKSRTDLSPEEKERLDKALKVLANAASYGIYAEMNRQESDQTTDITCHGIDPEPFSCRVAHPDIPGKYCFPPLASLITGSARLMLALLERCVTDLGGTYAMEDTDSMAIVASETGGIVSCHGGEQRTSDGQSAVKALTWRQVKGISERFSALNPYDRRAIPGSILKIEDDNFDFNTKQQRQLFCVAISAKRYALFTRADNGTPVLAKWSEHGLGHILNPMDQSSSDRDWIAQVWLDIIRRNEGLPVESLKFADLPAIGRVTVSSPAVMKPFANFNSGKDYADQIKPFNFILTCQIMPLGHPSGTDPDRFHLIAPFSSDSRTWLKVEWIDRYSNKRFRISTSADHGTRNTARVKTYGDVLREYEFHPESKCADSLGLACNRQTVGLLRRRHLQIEQIKYIGKESNSLEDVESGMLESVQNAYTEYPDVRRDEWQTVILPMLRKFKLPDLVARTGMSRRALIDLRAGRSRPHPKNMASLASVVQTNGLMNRAPRDSERAPRTAKPGAQPAVLQVPVNPEQFLYAECRQASSSRYCSEPPSKNAVPLRYEPDSGQGSRCAWQDPVV